MNGVSSGQEGARAATTHDAGAAEDILRQRLEASASDLSAGLQLARLEWERNNRTVAVEILSRLWTATRSPEAGDLLARMSLELARGLDKALEEDRAIVGRLAGMIRALHGPGGILVDTLQYDIIGGLAIDVLSLVPVFKAGWTERTGKKVVFFSGDSANPALVDMIARELPVFSDRSFGRLLRYCRYDADTGRFELSRRFQDDFFGRHVDLFRDLVEFTHSTNGRDYCRTPEEKNIGHAVDAPQIALSAEEEERGRRFLREALELPPEGWFVCVYARDGAYYNETPQSNNWYRNSDIRTFVPAIDEILASGGHVVRIGERVGTRLEHPDPRFFDYSNSAQRDPFLDIYLLAHCRFLLGSPSGLCHVAYAFRTPGLMVNTINVCTVSSSDLYIPKPIRDTRTHKRLKFDEFLERVRDHGDPGLFVENGNSQRDVLHVCYEDNTPEDIAAATREMLHRMAGTFRESEISAGTRERFRQTWLRFQPHMAETKIASSFLEAHPELF